MNVLHFLSAPAGSPASEEFWSETASALQSGNSVLAYFFHEGATALKDPRRPDLVQKGLHLFCCPRAAETFGRSGADQATLGGPGLLAELIERSASFRSFNVT
ncbi:MAG: hypothetical protein EBZ44_04030 [Verrucomicrobia bacterium]|nr:hypothetical protein [Verrucomicrobiota bacterium]NDA26307.1 hypothetical protein [Verrucomicrobiota bacterium]NDD56875.1 hypothetical protein [Verrucomicrobiota bacterium]NDD81780.1 hypothetical protein [Verrucomicrobiota bacterium]